MSKIITIRGRTHVVCLQCSKVETQMARLLKKFLWAKRYTNSASQWLLQIQTKKPNNHTVDKPQPAKKKFF